MGSRVELFAQIRRDARVEGASIRELARRHQVARKTVRKALSSPVPPERKTPVRSSPRLDPYKPTIDAMLVEDTTAPRKQRHTARRILARLIEEHGADELSYSTVRDYVRVRRAQIDVEAGRRVEVFVPQEHAPGAEAEVDFGEVWIVLDGVKTKCHMFIFRLSHSGKAIHRIYPTQAQEAFLEGHVEAFNEIGGVPVKHIRYDNLTSAVRAVEVQDDQRRIDGRIRTIGQDFAAERPFLAPLPADEFDPGLVLNPRVDRSSMITVRMVKYSVPARFIGRRVRVSLRASEVVVFDGRAVAARHQRIIAKGGQSVQLDHYLEVLKTKPGALPGSTALARARESGAFTSAHDAFWSASRRVNGDAAGTRELIDVLLLHRSMEAEDIEAGITAALGVGAVSADVVAVEGRRHASSIPAGGSRPDRHRGAHAEAKVQRVVSLTQRRLMDPAAVIAGLPPDKRPLPAISAYDELLAKRTEHSAGTASKENIS